MSDAGEQADRPGPVEPDGGPHDPDMPDLDRSGAEPAGDAYDWYRRAMALLGAGSADAALQLLDRVREVEPRSRSVLEAIGRAAFDARRYEESEAAFTELLDLAPDDDYAHYGLGLSLWRQQRFLQARDHLGMAFVMRPEQSAYGTALAQVKATLRARVEAGLPLEGPISVPAGDVREQVIEARAFGILDARALVDDLRLGATDEPVNAEDADTDTGGADDDPDDNLGGRAAAPEAGPAGVADADDDPDRNDDTRGGAA